MKRQRNVNNQVPKRSIDCGVCHNILLPIQQVIDPCKGIQSGN